MRTILLGDIGNRLDIADAEHQIASLRSQQRSANLSHRERELEIGKLQRELAEQKLAIQALTCFLVVKEVVDEKALGEFIQEVDAEDGVIDGQMSLDPAKPRLKFPGKAIEDGNFRKLGEEMDENA